MVVFALKFLQECSVVMHAQGTSLAASFSVSEGREPWGAAAAAVF